MQRPTLQWLTHPTQDQFYNQTAFLGTLLFSMSWTSTVTGYWWAAGVTVALLAMGIFVIYRHTYERPRRGKVLPVYNRGQSYLFMAGPLLVPMCVIAAHAWLLHGAAMPWWLSHWPGYLVSFAVMQFVGVVFRRFDEPRYKGTLMLESPTKRWTNHWQMQGCVTVLLTAIVPTWFMPGPEKFWTIGGAVLLAACGIADAFRKLLAEKQHVGWNKELFRPFASVHRR